MKSDIPYILQQKPTRIKMQKHRDSNLHNMLKPKLLDGQTMVYILILKSQCTGLMHWFHLKFNI